MNFEIFFLNGYGQFVWPAFIFTFFCCFHLYAKTLKKFKKQEKIFLEEFKQSQDQNAEIKKEKIIKQTLSGSII